MESRWSESEAARCQGADDCETRLAELVYVTRLLGAEPALAMHGAGNTSYKHAVPDAAGETRSGLFVKASGTDLASVEIRDFVVLDRQRLLGSVEAAGLPDEAFAAAAAACLLRPCSRRASIETPMHTVLPQPFVFHTHPEAILALCNRRDGEEVVTAALGREVVAVPYAPIGLALGHAVRSAWASTPQAAAFVLMHHGLVAWGPTARAAYEATIDIVHRAEAFLGGHHVRTLPTPAYVPTAERERRYAGLASVLGSILASFSPPARAGNLALEAALDADVVAMLDTAEGRHLALSAPLTPDCLIRSRKEPLWLERPRLDDSAAFRAQVGAAVADYQAGYRAYVARHRPGTKLEASSFLPRALMIPGLGVVTVGKDPADARMVRDIMVQGLRVKTTIWSTGGDYRSMSEEEMFDMEWRMHQQVTATSAPAW